MYSRKTLTEFLMPIEKADLLEALEISRRKTAFCDLRPRRTIDAHHLQKELAIPDQLVIDAWSASEYASPDTDLLLAAITAWQKSSSKYEKYLEICEALMHRAESASSDERWRNGFSILMSEVFGVGLDVGLETIETPPQNGERWTRLVAKAAAKRIVDPQLAF